MYCIQNLIQILESFITILAILTGGIWAYWLFIKNREKFPKADISHTVQKIDMKDKILIRLTIRVKNLGKVKLPVKSGEVRLQQIKPITTAISDTIDEFHNIENEKKNDIEWPLLEERI